MNEFVRSPPSWIVLIVIAILTAHAIDKLIKIVRGGVSHLIEILELYIALVLSFLAIHSYYEGMLPGRIQTQWYDQPLALVVALIFFCFASIGLYLASRAQQPSGRRRNR
jgi:hypothetical protein